MKFLLRVVLSVFHVFIIAFSLPVCIWLRSSRTKRISKNQPRLIWGTQPIINFAYWNRALQLLGYRSISCTIGVYPNFNFTNWDFVKSKYIHRELFKTFIFLKSIISFDVIFTDMNGFIFGNSFFRFLEAQIFHIHGMKIVILPYGGDQWIYHRIRSLQVQHVYQINYPQLAKKQKHMERVSNYWNSNADVVIPGLCGVNGMGRWDVLTICPLHIDTAIWKPRTEIEKSSSFKVVHFPNHRGVKGTEFIVSAIEKLKQKGYPFELILIENTKNEIVRSIISAKADVVVENIIGHGHGLSAVESMALGIPTIINCEDDSFYEVFRNYSFFNECPLVSANHENLAEILINLYLNPNLRKDLSEAGIQYVAKYHSFKAAQELFSAILKKISDPSYELIHFFHPVIGFYKDHQKIRVPLNKNRIIEF